MSVSFCHTSAPLVAQDFGDFTDMVRANEVNTSSSNVQRIEFSLGWRFQTENEDGGCYCGEIPLSDLPQFIENCEIALESPRGMTETVTRRINQLRVLAKQAMHYNEPITYG